MVNKDLSLDEKADIIKSYIEGNITRRQASIKLGISLKWVSIMKAKYTQCGINAFAHKNNGNTNAKRIDVELESRIVELYEDKYQIHKFNFSHFYEKLISKEKLEGLPSKKTVYNILTRHNITSTNAHRKSKQTDIHAIRNRRSSFGELVQLDASVEYWINTNEKRNLHIAIDDATSMIIGAYFDKEETTYGYYNVVKQILENYGIPVDFYTDNRSSFINNRGKTRKEREANVQFRRVCTELGIGLITTSIAQAKGRVERSFRTHQDRLISELSLENITTMDKANEYLHTYIKEHNQLFAHPCNKSSFTILDKNIDLNILLSIHTTRSILNGNVVSYKNMQLMPMKDNSETLKLRVRTKVTVVKCFNNEILIKHNNNYYKTKLFRYGRATANTPPKDHRVKRHKKLIFTFRNTLFCLLRICIE
jgi:hypothetical protein